MVSICARLTLAVVAVMNKSVYLHKIPKLEGTINYIVISHFTTLNYIIAA